MILMDEMKIQESLVWDKQTGYLIGFVDLGDTENTRKLSLGQTHRLSY